MREFDRLTDRVVQVLEVVGSGTADRNGIMEGDLIVAINDRIVASVDDIHRLLAQIPQSISLNLTVIRGNKKTEVAFPAPNP